MGETDCDASFFLLSVLGGWAAVAAAERQALLAPSVLLAVRAGGPTGATAGKKKSWGSSPVVGVLAR